MLDQPQTLRYKYSRLFLNEHLYKTDKSVKLPPGWISWESAGLLSRRSRVRTPDGPILRVFR